MSVFWNQLLHTTHMYIHTYMYTRFCAYIKYVSPHSRTKSHWNSAMRRLRGCASVCAYMHLRPWHCLCECGQNWKWQFTLLFKDVRTYAYSCLRYRYFSGKVYIPKKRSIIELLWLKRFKSHLKFWCTSVVHVYNLCTRSCAWLDKHAECLFAAWQEQKPKTNTHTQTYICTYIHICVHTYIYVTICMYISVCM